MFITSTPLEGLSFDVDFEATSTRQRVVAFASVFAVNVSPKILGVLVLYTHPRRHGQHGDVFHMEGGGAEQPCFLYCLYCPNLRLSLHTHTALSDLKSVSKTSKPPPPPRRGPGSKNGQSWYLELGSGKRRSKLSILREKTNVSSFLPEALRGALYVQVARAPERPVGLDLKAKFWPLRHCAWPLGQKNLGNFKIVRGPIEALPICIAWALGQFFSHLCNRN